MLKEDQNNTHITRNFYALFVRSLDQSTMLHSTDSVLMVAPSAFGFNTATSFSNRFQHPSTSTSSELQYAALREFNTLVEVLQKAGVHVNVFNDDADSQSPDSLFPNNWFSTHDEGTLVLYPMAIENRRLERRPHLIEFLEQRATELHGTCRMVDLRSFEEQSHFLEGTGSMILARDARIAFMSTSVRSSPTVLRKWCETMKYQSYVFRSTDAEGNEIYHTNVMMSIGSRLAVVCTEAIPVDHERRGLVQQLEQCGRHVLELTLEQMNAFAANMLQLQSTKGHEIWAMSTSAWDSLLPPQRAMLEADGEIVMAAIPTIEQCGGGSVRCMLAELY